MMKNLFKKSFSAIFVLSLVLVVFISFISINKVNAEVTQNFTVSDGQGCNFYGNVSLNKTGFIINETITASATGSASCNGAGTISNYGVRASQDGGATWQNIFAYAGGGGPGYTTFTAPNFGGTGTIHFEESLTTQFPNYSTTIGVSSISYTVSSSGGGGDTSVPPTIINPVVNFVTSTVVGLQAQVTGAGMINGTTSATITERGICYFKQSQSPSTEICIVSSTPPSLGVFGMNPVVTAPLTPSTPYHWYGYAKNSAGLQANAWSTFTTSSSSIPLTNIDVSGTHQVGQVVTATNLLPVGAVGNVDYQWQFLDCIDNSNGEDPCQDTWVNIPGKTSTTYTIENTYLGFNIQVQATGKSGYTGVVVSGPQLVTAPTPTTYTVTATAGANGTITPASRTVNSGSTTTFTVTPNSGYTSSVGGTCGGALVGTIYTTNPITANCTVTVTFTALTYTATATAGANGTITPASRTVNSGSTTTFTVTPNSGYTSSVGGTCGGALVGTIYTTNPITANCTVVATFTNTGAVPTVTSPTCTNLTPTSLTAGANVTSLGTPASISARGTCVSTGSPANCLPATGTTTGIFTHSRTGLTPSTQYYIYGYADNATGRGYSVNTTCTTPATPTIDLTASSPTPTTASIGVPINFSSTILNNGNSSTGATFFNSFQIATSVNGTGFTSMISSTPSPMTALASGASSNTTSVSHTFNGSPVTRSIRACADNNTSMVGAISESNEGNNCSAWVNVTLNYVTYTLTTTKSGTGSGTITSAPAGINCGLDCNEVYVDGTSVSLVATPTSGSSFAGWSGGGCSGTGACNTSIDSNKTINAVFTLTPLVPDLTTSVITPTTALVGTPTVFSATVTNIGTGGTVSSFNNILQWSDINSPLTVNTVAAKSMSALIAGASATYTQSLTFNNPGKYNARVCADKSNAGDVNGAISEADENNNCGAWVIFEVGGSPDLTAGNITPTSATVGVSTVFSATITNIGNDTTGVPFYNIVQWFNVVTPATVTTTVKKSMGILIAGANNIYTQDIKFIAEGQYNVRACADKSTALDANGLVGESNENNNCGSWTTVTVTNSLPAITVSLSASPAGPLTALGATNLSWTTTGIPDSCDATGVDWSGTNIINGSPVTQRSGMPAKTYVFGIVCHKAGELDASDTVTVVVNPVAIPITVSLSASPAGPLTALGATNLSWTTTGIPDSCDATGVDWSGTNIINGSPVTQRSGMPAKTYVFGIVCHKGGVSDATSSVTVVVGTGTEINGIDLTASTPADAIVQVNDSRTYTSNITNLGNTGTGVKFPNVFRVSTIGEGDLNPTKYPTTPDALMPSLDALSSDTASFSHTFNTPGIYYISACADKNTSMAGDITEVYEDNNCSGWAEIKVIPLGGDIDGYWGPWGVCTGCVNGINGTQTRVCIPPVGNGADCVPDVNGNTTSQSCDTCPVGGGLLNINFVASPKTIYKGKSSVLTWTSNADSCTGTNFDTQGKANSSELVIPVKVSPIINTTYTLKCEKSGTNEESKNSIKVININIIEG